MEILRRKSASLRKCSGFAAVLGVLLAVLGIYCYHNVDRFINGQIEKVSNSLFGAMIRLVFG